MIPFSPPRIDQKIIDEVTDTLKSGWITTGPKTKRFEKMLSEYTAVPATICLNSATAGLELMLRWYGVGPGDEVILPAYTYSATANVIVHCGAKPVFVDVRQDFTMDPVAAREAVTERTKVIMPVDFGGWPCDYNTIMELVKDPEIVQRFRSSAPEQKQLGRILVLSDAAHSLGAFYHGKRTGALADVTVFSFHAVKNLTTAEGGAVALCLPPPFDNEALYRKLCVRTLHGQDKDALAKTQRGNWKYDIVEAGYKMNMTDILASIGIVELGRYEQDTLVKRRQIFQWYDRALEGHPWAILPVHETEAIRSSCHVYALRIRGAGEAQRDDIMQRIAARDVSVNVHFIPVPGMSFYAARGYSMENYPVSRELFASEISLPVFYDLTEKQAHAVTEAVIRSVEEVMA
jgi:dTDP-4-amino-4,6-dideoxygalactose transaminase